MRAPPESLRPMMGAPTFIARSITLTIFSAYASASDPPNTVKSWLKMNTRRPSIVPWPVTTPSPSTACSAAPNALDRDVTNASNSTNDPASRSRSRRSRAVSLPRPCCCSILASPPPSRDSARIDISRAMRSSFVGTAPPCKTAAWVVGDFAPRVDAGGTASRPMIEPLHARTGAASHIHRIGEQLGPAVENHLCCEPERGVA